MESTVNQNYFSKNKKALEQAKIHLNETIIKTTELTKHCKKIYEKNDQVIKKITTVNKTLEDVIKQCKTIETEVTSHSQRLDEYIKKIHDPTSFVIAFSKKK